MSSVGQGLCWLCGTGRMRMLWVWSGAWECPPCSLPKLHFSSRSRSRLPTNTLPSLVMLPSPQQVSSVGQGLCWLCMHRPHEDVVGLEWCMGMPPLVHFLDFIFLLVNVSPPCDSLPCHASFAAAGEFGWAGVVLAVRHRPHEDVVGLEWCMGMPPLFTS